MTYIFILLVTLTFSFARAASVPGEYIVKIRPGSETQLSIDENDWLDHSREFALIKKDGSQKSALQEIESDPAVVYAEPNFIYATQDVTPNDPKFGDTWGMRQISAPAAWQRTTGDRRIVVAVVDTGVGINHPDIRANLWVNQAEKNGRSGVDDDGNGVTDDLHGYSAMGDDNNVGDVHGHGSHVAGTIGAVGNNGTGVAGVNWQVSIMVVRVFGKKGTTTMGKILSGVDYAVRMNPNVMNFSWGGTDRSQALYDMLLRANEKNIFIAAAAGNNHSNNDEKNFFPANYDLPNLTSVAASTSSGPRANFSNYGKNKVHVAAPGANILSLGMRDSTKIMSGTSMASPHVAGVAALVLSVAPNLTPAELRTRLIETSRPHGQWTDKVVADGIVDADRAVGR